MCGTSKAYMRLQQSELFERESSKVMLSFTICCYPLQLNKESLLGETQRGNCGLKPLEDSHCYYFKNRSLRHISFRLFLDFVFSKTLDGWMEIDVGEKNVTVLQNG